MWVPLGPAEHLARSVGLQVVAGDLPGHVGEGLPASRLPESTTSVLSPDSYVLVSTVGPLGLEKEIHMQQVRIRRRRRR